MEPRRSSNNGTPLNLNDDFFSYRPFLGANGLEQFSYFIVDDEGSSSVAQVSIALGNQNASAKVAMDFQLVRENGTPINPALESINVGERIGVQIHLEDLQPFPDYVFAGYLDVLYSQGILAPATNGDAALCISSHDGRLATELDFFACIGNEYVDDATSGSAARPGVINEFGSIGNEVDNPNGSNPALLATIFFDAIAPGTAQVVGSPADRLPESDTLVFGDNDPIEVSKIRYDAVQFQVVGSSLQNLRFPQDVDGDGEATALDALIVINHMHDLGEGESGSTASRTFFTDVNGDSKITAVDALQVINYISRRNANSEAEPTARAIAPSTAIRSVAAQLSGTDAAFADLAADEVPAITTAASKLTATESGGGQSAAIAPIINVTDDDRDEDDSLDLFADDVFGQWNG